MKVHTLEREQILGVSREEAWEFFSNPRNLEAITPPEMGFSVERCADGPIFEGQFITLRVKIAPLIRIRWISEITSIDPGRAFVDDQRSGPYKLWHHRHSFEPVEGGVRMVDTVNYAVGFGPFGEIAHGLFVRRQLGRIFDFRRELLEQRFGTA